MLTKQITYNDFDGNEVTENFYFNLTKAELLEMEIAVEGGMSSRLQRLMDGAQGKEVYDVFKDMILAAVGERPAGSKMFKKSVDYRDSFAQTEAFSNLIFGLIEQENAGADFFNALMPKELMEQVNAQQAKIAQDQLPTPQQTFDTPVEDTVSRLQTQELRTVDEPVETRPWVIEDREPTDAEMRNMSKDDMFDAFKRREARRAAQPE